MPDLGNAYVNIVPKAPGIEGKIEGILSGGGGGAELAGASLGKKLLGGMAALGIGKAIGDTVKSAFEAGGNLQQSFGGLETIYGEAATQAKEFAMQAAEAGISANSYAEQAVSFGAALKMAYGGDTQAAMNAANTAILDMADNAAKMGTPLESIQTAYQGFAKQNYTMLDNLKLGYGGTKQEMERLLADAQALTGVEYNIDNLGDVYDAIHVIQGELGLTGVAASEAETTLTGSMNAVKASWENVMAAMTTGEGLDTAMQNMSKSVGNFANNVLTMLGNLAPQVPGLIMGLVDIILAHLPSFIESGIQLIANLAVGLAQGLPQLMAKIPEIIFAVFNAFRQVNWWDIGVQIVSGIIQGLGQMAGALWNAIKNMAASAWRAAKNALGIASPSKVMADEVGKWIPAGMAEGIEDNLSPIRASAEMMSNAALPDVQPATMFNAAQPTDNAGIMEQLIDALHNMKYDLYLDGQQITDSVTVRQRRMARAGGLA
jgi:hypothetical protein